jgi:hypothetical protein
VPTERLLAAGPPQSLLINRAMVHGVVEAPGGAHFTSCVPDYPRDEEFQRVDMACGIGYDRAAALGAPGNRFHEVRVVVTNLAVLDFRTPARTMRLRSVHPGVPVGDVLAATGFPLSVPDEVPVTRRPSAGELALIRDQLDPAARRERELR